MKNYKNNTKMFGICLLILGIVAIFSFGINATSAANSSSVYVSTHGNDSYDGLNSTYTSGINGPKATIKNATGTVASDGTVHIARGTYNENNIQINTNMTIIGENQKNTIINGQQSGNPIFTIASGVNITIINLTLTNGMSSHGGGAIYNNGTLTVDNSTFINNTANEGGAIYNGHMATLTVDNSTFTNNTANYDYGGAIDNENGGTLTVDNSTFTNNTASNPDYGAGGAIDNGSMATLTVDNSTFTNNTANYDYGGGAIYNFGGTLIIDNSTFTNNTATSGGGAIDNFDGTLTVDNSTFINNTAYDGGAIYNENGSTLTVDNSTFTNNTANYDYGGGAIYNENGSTLTVDNSTFTNNTANYGGAIDNGGTLTVDNSTFTNNTANYGYGGGAIFNFSGTLTVDNSTFTNNTANYGYGGGAIYGYMATLTVDNSTFTNNTANYGYGGGAIINDGGIVTVKFSRIVGNNKTDVYNSSGRINAEDNWWGTNFVGTNPLDAGRVNFTVTNWIVLTITSKPQTINDGDKSTVTADLLHDNLGNYLNPINGHVPDGITVNFSSDGLGTVNPETNTTINGSANTTFTGHFSGVSEVSATVDQQTVTTNITNQLTPTNSTTVNVTTTTIPMQHTGIPIVGLIVGILSVLGGSIISRKK